MTANELAILKEVLSLASGSITQLESIDSPQVKHIANILSAAVAFGEMIAGVI